MSEQDLKMLFSMLIKMSEDCKSYGQSNYSYGWESHQKEREYFEKRLKQITDLEEQENEQAD